MDNKTNIDYFAFLEVEKLIPFQELCGRGSFYLVFYVPTPLYHFSNYSSLQGVKVNRIDPSYWLNRSCEFDELKGTFEFGKFLTPYKIDDLWSCPEKALEYKLKNGHPYSIFSEKEFFEYIEKNNLIFDPIE